MTGSLLRKCNCANHDGQLRCDDIHSQNRGQVGVPYLPGVRSGLSLVASASGPCREPLPGVFGLPCCCLSGVVASVAAMEPATAGRWGLPLWLGLLHAPTLRNTVHFSSALSSAIRDGRHHVCTPVDDCSRCRMPMLQLQFAL